MQPAMTNPADRRAKKRNSHIYIRKPYIEAFYLVPFVVQLDFRVPSVAHGCAAMNSIVQKSQLAIGIYRIGAAS